jgi:gamma-glutamyl-gamma-aminobutyrate hydrolase PuuD
MRLIAIGNWFGAHVPFKEVFDEVVVIPQEADVDFEKDDVVLFGGGADISPTIYEHKVSSYTGATANLSTRDWHEVRHFKNALKAECGIIGICRGAQLACAMSGGSLIQHVDGHSGRDHEMTTHDGQTIMVSSVHHQMMNPEKANHELLGYSTQNMSQRHIIQGEEDIYVEKEPEVIYFTDTRSLAIQYHPEFMDAGSAGVKYALNLAKEKFNVRG